MDQPKIDKDIELAKVNVLAEEWRGMFQMKLGALLTTFIAVSAVLLAAEYANQISWTLTILGVIFTGLFSLTMGKRYFVRPYDARLQRLVGLLKKVEAGQSIGELSELLKEKY